jgi:hypothetical protein
VAAGAMDLTSLIVKTSRIAKNNTKDFCFKGLRF